MRQTIERLPGSLIREVANAGLGREDVLAFWFGEGDERTPEPVCRAAAESLARGETFYSHNLGLPELREAIARYTARLHPAAGGAARIAVTSSGVTALMVAMQLLLEPGDEVVAVVPVWPNLTAQPQVLSARVTRVALRPDGDGAWRVDLDRLRAAVTPRTRVLLVNSPNNPTGWTLSADEQRALLAHCRTTGTWIVADEVYERLHFGGAAADPGACAPSFLDHAAPDDRLLVVHSFSKSFRMTGWRLGWLVVPADGGAALDAVGRLIEFNSSCAPVFVQRGGLAALALADTLVSEVVAGLRGCRDRLVDALAALPRVTVARPPGGLYAFFRVDGEPDSLRLARRLVTDHGLGLAPGAAFGPEGEGWLRWCFASHDPTRLDRGVERLAGALRL